MSTALQRIPVLALLVLPEPIAVWRLTSVHRRRATTEERVSTDSLRLRAHAPVNGKDFYATPTSMNVLRLHVSTKERARILQDPLRATVPELDTTVLIVTKTSTNALRLRATTQARVRIPRDPLHAHAPVNGQDLYATWTSTSVLRVHVSTEERARIVKDPLRVTVPIRDTRRRFAGKTSTNALSRHVSAEVRVSIPKDPLRATVTLDLLENFARQKSMNAQVRRATTANGFSCNCDTGFEGTLCQTDVNECENTPCFNGGICINQLGSFSCDCTGTDFEGNRCEVFIDECLVNTCVNGATCVTGNTLDRIEAVSFFEDASCAGTPLSEQVVVNGVCAPSLANPLDNILVTCAQEVSTSTWNIDIYRPSEQPSASCSGTTQFYATGTGSDCVPVVRTSNMNPTVLYYTIDCGFAPSTNTGLCLCTAGYEGEFCQDDIDECALSPCQNGGTCTNAIGSFSCACAAGYTGPACETNIDDCASSPCQNGATCTDGLLTYTCTCDTGYLGTQCETLSNECETSPCMNGGTCINLAETLGIGAYDCDCTGTGYEGSLCETATPCTPDPCNNGGTCVEGETLARVEAVSFFSNPSCTGPPAFNQTVINGVCTPSVVDSRDNIQVTCATETSGSTWAIDIYRTQPSVTCTGTTQFATTGAGQGCEPVVRTSNGVPTVLYYQIDCGYQPSMDIATCLCPLGFSGPFCDIALINECTSSPCQNGGTCTDDVVGFTCDCPPGTDGSLCETNTLACPCWDAASLFPTRYNDAASDPGLGEVTSVRVCSSTIARVGVGIDVTDMTVFETSDVSPSCSSHYQSGFSIIDLDSASALSALEYDACRTEIAAMIDFKSGVGTGDACLPPP